MVCESFVEHLVGSLYFLQQKLFQRFSQISIFIALIHPIQWTITYPVGADRPAKRQKKTSCISNGQAGPVLCTRQVVYCTSFQSRQRDVISSFSFGPCIVYTKFLRRTFFEVLITISSACAFIVV